jgi:predicted RNA-binding Zn-ribbon protein involved in translation (DUF1610 family)
MRTQFAPEETLSLFASVFACPRCKHLMFYRGLEPWTLMYGHQLDRHTFECDTCGNLVVHIVDEDQE